MAQEFQLCHQDLPSVTFLYWTWLQFRPAVSFSPPLRLFFETKKDGSQQGIQDNRLAHTVERHCHYKGSQNSSTPTSIHAKSHSAVVIEICIYRRLWPPPVCQTLYVAVRRNICGSLQSEVAQIEQKNLTVPDPGTGQDGLLADSVRDSKLPTPLHVFDFARPCSHTPTTSSTLLSSSRQVLK